MFGDIDDSSRQKVVGVDDVHHPRQLGIQQGKTGEGRYTYLDGNLVNEAICSLRLGIPRWTLGRHSGKERFKLS
jgi:hypothetical protein